jgi:pyruvate dehydrogenase E1 component
VRAYDPAYAYETAVIVFDGLKRMYQDGETAIYYITVENESYQMPEMPEGVEEGIIRGMYKLSSRETDKGAQRVQLLGSGAILNASLGAQEILANDYGIASDVWSVTSYTQLRRDAHETQRWNMLHPTEKPRQSYVEQMVGENPGPFIAASDYVRAVPEQLNPWIPNGLFTLGTDGMGRSETRENLRRHFEVDTASITIAALYQLSRLGQLDQQSVADAIRKLDIDPEKADPFFA